MYTSRVATRQPCGLEQDGCSGFTPQTWDVAGNEANFFVRDATNGSTLPFRIFPGASTSQLIIDSTGVAIGTSSATDPLLMTSMTKNNLLRLKGANEAAQMTFEDPLGNLGFVQFIDGELRFFVSSAFVPTLALTAGGPGNVGIGLDSPTFPLEVHNGAHVSVGGQWMDASSREYKDQIQPLSTVDALEALRQLEPVTFVYKAVPDEPEVGFIAEDVPDLVASKDRKSLDSMDVVAVLIKVVQQQEEMISRQSTAISPLAVELAQVKANVAKANLLAEEVPKE